MREKSNGELTTEHNRNAPEQWRTQNAIFSGAGGGINLIKF